MKISEILKVYLCGYMINKNKTIVYNIKINNIWTNTLITCFKFTNQYYYITVNQFLQEYCQFLF